MEPTTFQTICVCGAGTMGSGIAQACAQAGFQTLLFDVQPAALQKAQAAIAQNLQQLQQKGKLDAATATEIGKRLQYVTQTEACRADLIIEAVVEQMEVKQQLLAQLQTLNGPTTIIASNTSSLSITALQQQLPAAGRVAGLHFFNPATIMKLVEVVQGKHTEAAVITQLVHFVQQLGKTPVVCKDAPGFIVNRVARPYYIEALRLVEEGVADYSTIDTLMEATGFKMGPFRLMDLIGNDVNYAVSCSVYEQLQQPRRLQPSPLQQQKVQAGKLGRKTGEGYYLYS
ncbi:MAG: 3-hydroxyacyl-CoA dehydrogenase NAD-binding domain-containing protein [Lacibacter sp.]